MRALQRIQQCIREENYRISSHANEEMADDELEVGDIESIILSCKNIRKYTLDPRGVRYEIYGDSTDGRQASVICRFPFRRLADNYSLGIGRMNEW